MSTTTCLRCRGETYRVLVVDDHPRSRETVATLVRLDDHRLNVRSLCQVSSGEEAVALARVYKPHVVFMDIQMPGINGFEATRRIKQDLPSVQVVMVTALDDSDYRQEAARLGAVGFLTKDRVGTELVPLLSRILSSLKAG